METLKSQFLKLTKHDLVKGFLMAALTVIVTSLISVLETGIFPTDWIFWKTKIILGLSAGCAYLLKNWLTNSDDKFLKKEAVK